MVLLLVFLLSLCTNFNAKSMHDNIWGPVDLKTKSQAWPVVQSISPAPEAKSPSPVSPVLEKEDSSDLECLAKQVADATLCEEEAGAKENAPENHEDTGTEYVQDYTSKPLPYIVAWHRYDLRAHEALVEYLDAKNPVDVCDANGYTGLHIAVYYGDASAVQLLVQHKANPNIRNKNGLTPLHMVVISKRKDILRILLDYKDDEGHGIVDVDMPTYTGDTALHFAVEHGQITMAKRLLDHKANPNLPNKSKQTARDYALKKGFMNLFVN